MTETKTVTEETVHGSIEYEIVECDSCGQEILPEECNEFTIGDVGGVACDMCVDQGPSGFPRDVHQLDRSMVIAAVLFGPLMMGIFGWTVITDPSTWDSPDRENWTFSFCYAVGTSLWAIAITAILFHLF